MPETPIITGSISEGTLRLEDIIPKMLAALTKLSPATAQQFIDQNAEALDGIADEDADASNIWLYERLTYHLNAALPEGWYFGVHEGDGACFGIWQEAPDA